MKKLLTTILAASMLLIGTNAFAQFSVGAGYLNSTNTTKYNSDNKASSNLNGFYVGGFFNADLGRSFSFTPGVYFSFLAASDAESFYNVVKTKADVRETYLSIPLNFRYNYQLADDMRIFVYAGPTLSCGLSGKVSNSATTIIGSVKGDLNYYDDLDYKRFDCLLGGGLGFEISDAIQITVGYKYGLINTCDSDDIKRHRSQINIGLAYIF